MRAGWSILGLAAACSQDPLGLPAEVERSRSLAIGLYSASNAAEVHLFDTTPSLHEDFEVEASGELELLLFESSLSDFGLTRGLLASDPAGEALPKDVGAFRARADGTWSKLTREELRLSEFRYPVETRSACLDLSLEALETELASSTSAITARLIRLDDDRALILGSTGLALYDRDTGISSVEWTGPSCFKDGFLERPGSVVVADCAGGVFRGVVEGRSVDLQVLWSSPELGTAEWLAGGPSAGSLDVFVLRQTGVIEWWDGGRVTHTTVLSPVESPIGGLEWLGPGRAAMGLASSNRVVVFDHGTPREEEIPGGTGLTHLRTIEGLGLVASDTGGQFFVRDGGWSLLGSGLAIAVTNAVVPFDGGFMFVIAGGGLGQFVLEKGPCQEVVAGFPLDDAERLGDLVVASGHLYNLSHVMIAVVRSP
ncbi:MAG: hypothetical protein HY791_07795 [Deltaproteobacteria bacterium]|nr:hypothetical protein [Deltaproteobacteria bacterium]